MNKNRLQLFINSLMMHSKSSSLKTTIIRTGLLAGTLDILCALIQFYIRTGRNPVVVLKFIASGVFGETAFNGGVEMAIAGLFFHFVIAFIWTIFFFLLYPKISFLSKNKFMTGFAYGFFVWIIMTRVVLPLSNTPKIPFNISQAAIAILILVFAVGLPISIMANKYYSTNKQL
ncbi:MAG: hypothetical protein AB1521_10455 [Bacteroidota bacterium]